MVLYNTRVPQVAKLEIQSAAPPAKDQPLFPGRNPSPGQPPAPMAPAVPSALFLGTKQPKIASPPTRIRKESSEIPEIRHSGSHEFGRSSGQP